MNRKEILNELMKKYSFEKAHSIRQIVTEDREFENGGYKKCLSMKL